MNTELYKKYKLQILLVADILVLALLIGAAGAISHGKLRDLSQTTTEERPSGSTSNVPQMTTNSPTSDLPSTSTPPETESLPAIALPEDLSVNAEHAFIFDMASNDRVWSVGELDETIYPASVTKLWTVLVALSYVSPDDVVTVGDEIDLIARDSSRAKIPKGARVDVRTVIKGMLLPSGNDAAYVLAAACGRRIAGEDDLSAEKAVSIFVERMNEYASTCGLSGSHFANPDGYHNKEHYTTMRDIITISKMAMLCETITECTILESAEVTFDNGSTVVWKNSNLFVQKESAYYLPEAIGLKTGYTDAAGYCLVAAAEFEGRMVIVGVFGCDGHYTHFNEVNKLFDAIKSET